jgi:hypothetical protein
VVGPTTQVTSSAPDQGVRDLDLVLEINSKNI